MNPNDTKINSENKEAEKSNELTNFEEFSKLYSQKFKSKNMMQPKQKEYRGEITELNKEKDEGLKTDEGDQVINNRIRAKKRSEQMKKRLDKISGDKFVFKKDDHDTIEAEDPRVSIRFEYIHDEIVGSKEISQNFVMEDEKVDCCSSIRQSSISSSQKFAFGSQAGTDKKKKYSMHRNTNSIIGYDKEEGLVYEVGTKIKGSISEDNYFDKNNADAHKATKSIISNNATNDKEDMNVSNLEDSLIIDEEDSTAVVIKPLTESEQIIVNNNIIHGSNTSFIPIKNNLNLINMQKPSNVTDSYLMALLGGSSTAQEHVSFDNKNNFVEEIIEEEESFQDSEIPTPKYNRFGSTNNASSLELKKNLWSVASKIENTEGNQKIVIPSSFSNPLSLKKNQSVDSLELEIRNDTEPLLNNKNKYITILNADTANDLKVHEWQDYINLKEDIQLIDCFSVNDHQLREDFQENSSVGKNVTSNRKNSKLKEKEREKSKIKASNSSSVPKIVSDKSVDEQAKIAQIKIELDINSTKISNDHAKIRDKGNSKINPADKGQNTAFGKFRTKVSHSKSDGRQISDHLFKQNPYMFTKLCTLENKQEVKEINSKINKNNNKENEIMAIKHVEKKRSMHNLKIDTKLPVQRSFKFASTKNTQQISASGKNAITPKSNTSKAFKLAVTNFTERPYKPSTTTNLENKKYQELTQVLCSSKTQKVISNKNRITNNDINSSKSLKHIKNDAFSQESNLNNHSKYSLKVNFKDWKVHKPNPIVKSPIQEPQLFSTPKNNNKTHTHIKTGSEEVFSKFNLQSENDKSAVYVDLNQNIDILASSNCLLSSVHFRDQVSRTTPNNLLLNKGNFINDFRNALTVKTSTKKTKVIKSNVSPEFKSLISGNIPFRNDIKRKYSTYISNSAKKALDYVRPEIVLSRVLESETKSKHNKRNIQKK